MAALPGRAVRRDVPTYAAPARATDYRGLPPAVTFVGDIEPFRDETIADIENLRQAGVAAQIAVYPAATTPSPCSPRARRSLDRQGSSSSTPTATPRGIISPRSPPDQPLLIIHFFMLR